MRFTPFHDYDASLLSRAVFQLFFIRLRRLSSSPLFAFDFFARFSLSPPHAAAAAAAFRLRRAFLRRAAEAFSSVCFRPIFFFLAEDFRFRL